MRPPPGGSNKALYQLVCGHDVLLRLPPTLVLNVSKDRLRKFHTAKICLNGFVPRNVELRTSKRRNQLMRLYTLVIAAPN